MRCRWNFQKGTGQFFKNVLYIRKIIDLSQKNLTGYSPGRFYHICDSSMHNGIKVPSEQAKSIIVHMFFFINSCWLDIELWKWSSLKDILL